MTSAFVVPDEAIAAAIDGTVFVERKLAAMRAHATQMTADGPFFAMSDELGQEMWGREHYRLVKGLPAPWIQALAGSRTCSPASTERDGFARLSDVIGYDAAVGMMSTAASLLAHSE